MRVLVVGPDRTDPGGVSNYYNNVLPKLSGAVSPTYLEIGSTKGKRNRLYVLTDQVRLWRSIGHTDPDIVHLNPSLDLKGFLRDGLFLLLARLRRRPALVFFRGWEVSFEEVVSKYLSWFFRITYGRANGFIVLSESFASRLRGWGVEAPIFLGTTAVPDDLLEQFSLERRCEGVERSPVVKILYMARLEPAKGVLELLEAARLLLERGVPVSLTIAGDGPAMSTLESRVKLLGKHADDVSILGYVRGAEKLRVLREHHIFCLPTQYCEGMPNALLEAMAFGMAVVTCPAGGIPDFFDQQRMGALLQRADPGEIASAIERLVYDRERLGAIARYNHEYAKKRFLASTAAGFLENCYSGMVSHPGGRSKAVAGRTTPPA